MNKDEHLKLRYSNNSKAKEYLNEVGSVKLTLKELERKSYEENSNIGFGKSNKHSPIRKEDIKGLNSIQLNFQSSVLSKPKSYNVSKDTKDSRKTPFEDICSRLKKSEMYELDSNTYCLLFNKKKQNEKQKKLKIASFLDSITKKKKVSEIKTKGYSKLNNVNLNSVSNSNVNDVYRGFLNDVLSKRYVILNKQVPGKFGFDFINNSEETYRNEEDEEEEADVL